MRILSGIQPSGALHIGNYFGALRQFIDLQRENDAYYFVANYHALTSVRDADQLRAYTFDVIVTMLSLGLDPDRATLFVQSDVPETAELAWLLTTVTPMGWLEKCVSYKDKIQQGLPAEHGLFAYPVLQAADILLYDADLVPVGQDQKQHLEITRDVAERFNRVYGGGEDVFRLPKPYILDSVSIVPGLDGRKMSKSYNNTIDIFDEPAAIRKKVKRIVTDSTPVEAPKDPETDPLFNLFKLFAAGDELAEVERRYREGGIGYGEVKSRLAEAMIARFAPAREQRAEWLAHPERVAEVRAAAAERAPGHRPGRPRPRPPCLRRGMRRLGMAARPAHEDARAGLIGDAAHDDRIRIIAILMNYPVYEEIGPTYNESRLRDGGSSPVDPAFAVSGLSSPLPPPSRFDLGYPRVPFLGASSCAAAARPDTDTDPTTS